MGSNQFPSLLSSLSLLDKDAMSFYLSETKDSHRLSNVDVVDVNQDIIPSHFLTPKSKSLISQLPKKSPNNCIDNSESEIAAKQCEDKLKSLQHRSLFMIDVTSNMGQRLAFF